MESAVERVTARWPGFVPAGAVRRSTKCAVVEGRLADRPVVAKVLDHADPIWRWYLLREIDVLRSAPPGAPAFVDADPDAAMLLMEHVPGRPLSLHRAAKRAPPRTLSAVLAAAERIAEWTPPVTEPPPDASAMRRRLLEDPTTDWIRDALPRLFDAAAAEKIRRALDGLPDRPAHGDLLARNVIVDGERVRFVDWECAGLHIEHWDRALLYASLPDDARAQVLRAGDGPAFFATAAFALARERALLQPASTRGPGLEAALAAVLRRI